MARKSPVHTVHTSRFWAGTYTSWCGQTVKKNSVQTVVFAGPKCGPCQKAKRARKGKR